MKLLGAIALCVMFSASTKAAAVLVIVGGTIIDGTGKEPIKDGVVVIQAQHIEYAGPRLPKGPPRGAKVIDANGRYVLPGLIDGHVHLSNMGSSADGVAGDVQGDGIAYGVALIERIAGNASTDLMAGETTVFDLGGPLEELKQVRDDINSRKRVGARMFISGPAFHENGHYPRPTPSSAANAFYGPREEESLFVGCKEAAAQVRKAILRGIDQLKIYQTGGEAKGWAGYDENNTAEEAAALVSAAHHAGLVATAHVRGIAGIRTSIQVGMDSLQHVVAMGWAMPQDLVQDIAKSRIPIFPTLMALKAMSDAVRDPAILYEDQKNLALPPELVAELFKTATTPALYTNAILYRQGYSEVSLSAQNLKRLNEAGSLIAMGTDAGTAYNFHGTAWKEVVAMVDAGLTPMQAIVAATQNSARAYKKNDLGTLERGKIADLIIVEGNPLDDVSNLKRIIHVFKDGEQSK